MNSLRLAFTILIFLALAGTGNYMFKRFEESMVFFPDKYPLGNWNPENTADLIPEDVYFIDDSSNQLHGWFFKEETSKTTLLFFHGNAGNLSGRYDWALDLFRLKINVFIIDYPGYGKSDGRPSEQGLYDSAAAALKHLEEKFSIGKENIILYGKSLGGVPATYLAEKHQGFKGLILQSTFTNAKEMSSRVLPIPMIEKFLSLSLNTLKRIARVQTPVLIIHSRDDEMIPFEMAERLYQAAGYPKYLKLFDGAGHNDLIHIHKHKLLLDIKAFIAKSDGEKR